MLPSVAMKGKSELVFIITWEELLVKTIFRSERKYELLEVKGSMNC